MLRIVLFMATNLAIMLVLGLVASLLGVTHWASAGALHLEQLLGFCVVFGFGGSFISLLLSKPLAKWSTKAQVITGTEGMTEAWLVETVRRLADKAELPMPEVAIFDGAPNAFATGATRGSSLVAVSTGLLRAMDRSQIEAVLAHEVAHVANGDMVTLTLLQGVVNTFVLFLARVLGHIIDRAVFKNDGKGRGLAYTACVFVLELVMGVLASLIVAKFSRWREYRADAGAARLLGGPDAMVSALRALGHVTTRKLPGPLAAFGITGGFSSLFASHPPLEKRIAALQPR